MTTVLDIMQTRGEKTPETQTEWEAYRVKRDERRKKNFDNALILLRANRLNYLHMPDVGNKKLLHVAKLDGSLIRYYPEEGKWYDGQDDAKYGIKNLIRHIKMGL